MPLPASSNSSVAFNPLRAKKYPPTFTKGKHSSSVPVNYTKIRTLKKPQGTKPGKVILSHYSTIYIDPDESFLQEVNKVDC